MCDKDEESLQHLFTCGELVKWWALGSKLITDFIKHFTAQDQEFIWRQNNIDRLITMVLGASDDPDRIIEWKRYKWITGLLSDTDIRLASSYVQSCTQAKEFPIAISRILRQFFHDVIWAYRNVKMKDKEKLLGINVKHMALSKKQNRSTAKSKGLKIRYDNNTNNTTQPTTTPPTSLNLCHSLQRKTTTERLSAESSQSLPNHLSMGQRSAWKIDLLNIAVKGKIERGASMNWTYHKQSTSVDRGKKLSSWGKWWESWKTINGVDRIGIDMGERDNKIDGDAGMVQLD